MQISAITHDDPRCTVACAAYVETVAALIAGLTPEAALATAERVTRRIVGDALRSGDLPHDAEAESDTEADTVLGAIARGRGFDLRRATVHGPGPLFARGRTGYVLTALTVAVAARLDQRPLPAVLADVVRLGGDADTNGAIAGGLLGARDGASAIPMAWRERLQFADELTAAAVRFAAVHDQVASTP